jgi:hypothetical protein
MKALVSHMTLSLRRLLQLCLITCTRDVKARARNQLVQEKQQLVVGENDSSQTS